MRALSSDIRALFPEMRDLSSDIRALSSDIRALVSDIRAFVKIDFLINYLFHEYIRNKSLYIKVNQFNTYCF